MPFLDNIASGLRLSDVVDIVASALFFYLLIVWISRSAPRTAARRAVAAGVIVALLYGLAVYFDLFLARVVLQVLLVVLLLGSLVVFQTELRRMVDQLGDFRPFGRQRERANTSPVNAIVEASARMAEWKTGALIALRGSDPWDRYVEGGIRLDGRVSMPLLLSLFNPTAPGHDGAVLIEGDRIKLFAAHLPLSPNLPGASRYGGTRHAAAVGLAEQCDALVVAVSEERGTISLAEHGQLLETESIAEVEARISAFWKKHHDRPRQPARESIWTVVQRAVLSLLFAILLWMIFAYRPDQIMRSYPVGIEYRNLPEGWGLVEPVPSVAQATISGSERAFNALDANRLVASFDLRAVDQGENEFVISARSLRLPVGLSLHDVYPKTVMVRAEPLREIEVAVEPRTAGIPPESLVVLSLSVSPDTITILIPQDGGPVPTRVPTESVDLARITESTTVTRSIRLPEGARLGSGESAEVEVAVTVGPRIPPAP